MNLADYLAAWRGRIDETLDALLPPPAGPARRVAEAMRYAVLGGGKRLRPIVAIAACEACGGDGAEILEAAAALELLHTYSLVHDDLPAMDDDELRRGRPTTHCAFGEALAILAGDALHTLTFEVLASRPEGAAIAARRAEAVETLARRAGYAGMVGGQVADLEAEGEAPGPEVLRWIHERKTGALFSASAEIGAILAAAAPRRRGALARYGESLGLAFQIADDLLDVTATAAELGKTPGKDQRAGKATYPAMFGMSASRQRAEGLVAQARGLLSAEGIEHAPLHALVAFAVARSA